MNITRMGHVALRVADLDRAVTHATEVMGLLEVQRTGGTSYLTCNARHHELLLIADTAPSLDHIGLEVERVADLEQAQTQLVRAGVKVLSEQPGEEGITHAIRFVGPGDFVFKLFTGMPQNQPVRYRTLGVRPRKFSHVSVKSNCKPELEQFLTRVLGFRISDRVGQHLSWLRCNVDHHGIAIFQDERNLIHHYAFELQDFAAIGQLADHLRLTGQSLIFGPGRHGPGNNLFSYFFDADGFLIEFMADILRIDNEAAYTLTEWPVESPLILNQWGPSPTAEFTQAGIALAQPRGLR
jgi:catechol-2,3-dioxygenase